MTFDEREINVKIQSELKKYEILKKSFFQIYKSESEVSKNRTENFNKLIDIQEYDNTILKDIYSLFTNEMKNVEQSRNEHSKKIWDLILPVTDYYPEKLKKTKKLLEDLAKVKKTKNNLEKSKSQALDVSQNQKINKELVNSRREEKSIGDSLGKAVAEFERDRTIDNKHLFMHYIHSELKYHAAALEKLSQLFFEIQNKEPFIELEEFSKKYQIEFEPQKLDIDMKKIKKDEENRREEDSRQINNVYESKRSDMGRSLKKSTNTKGSINNEIGQSQVEDDLNELNDSKH